MRGALRSLIESHEGWEVCGEAEDGDEAVPKAAALNPDAIILDLVMPRMDGLEAARHILKAAPSVPIILHTLYHSAQVERAAQVMGIYKVTSKTNTADLFVELEGLFRDRAPTRTEPLGKARVSQVDGSRKKRSAH